MGQAGEQAGGRAPHRGRESARDAHRGARRGARRGEAARRAARVALGFLLRAAAVTLPLLALRLLFAPREPPISSLSDRQLADIGLTRADVARPHERTASPELEIQRLLRGRDWR